MLYIIMGEKQSRWYEVMDQQPIPPGEFPIMHISKINNLKHAETTV